MGLDNRLVPRGQALDAAFAWPRNWPRSPSVASGRTGYQRTSSGRSPTRMRFATSFVAA